MRKVAKDAFSICYLLEKEFSIERKSNSSLWCEQTFKLKTCVTELLNVQE